MESFKIEYEYENIGTFLDRIDANIVPSISFKKGGREIPTDVILSYPYNVRRKVIAVAIDDEIVMTDLTIIRDGTKTAKGITPYVILPMGMDGDIIKFIVSMENNYGEILLIKGSARKLINLRFVNKHRCKELSLEEYDALRNTMNVHSFFDIDLPILSSNITDLNSFADLICK